MAETEIPNRSIFRSQEVCELADVQLYVLRTWEAEFPDLGVSKQAGGPRVYRRADVERVLKIKHLLFVDGLTLAGARKRLIDEGLGPVDPPVADTDLASMLDEDTRLQLRDVRRGLQWILNVLSGEGLEPRDFVLRASPREQARAPLGRASTASKAKAPATRSGKKTSGRKR